MMTEKKDWKAFYREGLKFIEEKRWSNAASYLRHTNDLKPDDADVMIKLAYVLRQTRELTESLSLYRRIVAILPENPGVHYAWGLTLSELGRYEGAVFAFERALKFGSEPRHRCNRMLGRMYLAMGHNEVAKGHFEKYLEASKDSEYGDHALIKSQLSFIEKQLKG